MIGFCFLLGNYTEVCTSLYKQDKICLIQSLRDLSMTERNPKENVISDKKRKREGENVAQYAEGDLLKIVLIVDSLDILLRQT